MSASTFLLDCEESTELDASTQDDAGLRGGGIGVAFSACRAWPVPRPIAGFVRVLEDLDWDRTAGNG